MDNILAAMMEQLNQIHVCGADVERLCAVKQMLRQLQTALKTAKSNPETVTQERNDGHA